MLRNIKARWALVSIVMALMLAACGSQGVPTVPQASGDAPEGGVPTSASLAGAATPAVTPASTAAPGQVPTMSSSGGAATVVPAAGSNSGTTGGAATSAPTTAATSAATTAATAAATSAPTSGSAATSAATTAATSGITGGTTSGAPVNIAVVVKSVTSTYWKTVGAGVEAAAQADPNIKTSFLGANEETDIEGQIRVLEAQISAKVSAIAVAPSQADQVQPTLQKAVDAGIPVILIDTNIEGFTAKSAFVGTDNKLGGQKAGEYIAKTLKSGDKVAIIRGAAGDPVHNVREQGATDAMKAAGLEIVAVQPADSDRAKGQSVAENLLTANPDLKAIYATNDEMALGAVQAAQTAGRNDLIIVGFDASPDALTAIQDGKMAGSIAQFPQKIGQLGVETAAKVARGEKVDAFVNTGVDLVIKDNLSTYMK